MSKLVNIALVLNFALDAAAFLAPFIGLPMARHLLPPVGGGV